MFEIDHLMIETTDPLKIASNVAEQLGLPFAWPLIEKNEYTSIGVNFGDINIEFINFRFRFGIEGKKFKGFSGIAFKSATSLDDSLKRLSAAGINYRVGEDCEAHTTIIMEETQVFPTFFLVKYHFDTNGWTKRLENEFSECAGGKHHIERLKSVSIKNQIPVSLENEFQINGGSKNQIFFESRTGKKTVLSDLIENLEIIIA
ncbi:hypothetical protein [Thiorhodococcus fuscus]|uniref:VOC family protein n=1 Tax=Thiorhodococcus fuscus TaxID=527200 RepID=A0ABW4Y8B9_9GAMM